MNEDHKRIFIAFALSALVLFGWQALFPTPKTPVANSNPTTAPAVTNKTATNNVATAGIAHTPTSETQIATEPTKIAAPLELKSFDLKSNDSDIKIRSDFSIMSFKNKFADKKLNFIIGPEAKKSPFQVYIEDSGQFKPLNIVFDNNNTNEIISGRDNQYGVLFNGRVMLDGKLNISLKSSTPRRYRLVLNSSEKTYNNVQIRNYLIYGKDVEREVVDKKDERETSDGFFKWFGVDFNYHLFAVIFKEKEKGIYAFNQNALEFDTIDAKSELNLSFVFVKKDYDLLTGLGDKLNLSVDFGIFGILAVPILRGLQYIYKYIPNYGIAIILLTLFIRLLLFPLQLKSIKSMKKMQVLQPELKKIKEKHKDNPQKAQKETMELFKKAKANPLGGCLPLVLQMPVFFAFYRVLYAAVELVGAPFIFWIHDLSVKDPYYVLPVFMGAAMFLQSKLNPTTTADPAAQKMMMFMPVIFSFFMKDLPAGLNLYICVSTLFGIGQQLIVKSDAKNVAVA